MHVNGAYSPEARQQRFNALFLLAHKAFILKDRAELRAPAPAGEREREREKTYGQIHESWAKQQTKLAVQGAWVVSRLLRSNRVSLIVHAAGLLLLWLFYLTCTTYIGPGEFGIKQVLYSPFGLFGPMGTQNKIYETGFIISSQPWRRSCGFRKPSRS